jgi:hypothetical protein
MVRREHRAKSFTYDLLADWRPYAAPPLTDHFGWIYHGTVTLEGVTGALTWRRGWFGIAVGDWPVRNLGMWERIRITQEILAKEVPGWESAPTFPDVLPTIASSAFGYPSIDENAERPLRTPRSKPMEP